MDERQKSINETVSKLFANLKASLIRTGSSEKEPVRVSIKEHGECATIEFEDKTVGTISDMTQGFLRGRPLQTEVGSFKLDQSSVAYIQAVTISILVERELQQLVSASEKQATTTLKDRPARHSRGKTMSGTVRRAPPRR